MAISIRTEAEIEGMRLAGRLASEVLDMLTEHIRPGITTLEIDRLAHDYITQVQQAVPATLGYQPPGYPPYPASLCTSLNDVVCHGIPDGRALRDGDILNVDVTVIKDGWHGDNSRMYLIGETSIAARRLCAITFEAMWKGIVKIRPGTRLGDIGHAIQTFAEHAGFSVVREFCGHGVGDRFHEDPQVLHYGRPGTLQELKPGMTTEDIYKRAFELLHSQEHPIAARYSIKRAVFALGPSGFPFEKFFAAENYHQDYYNLHGEEPYCRFVIAPKVEKFRKQFKKKLKEENVLNITNMSGHLSFPII